MTEETYREGLFGREQLVFRYTSLGLAKLAAEEYVEKGPLAAALAALMSRPQAKGSLNRLDLRARIMRKIAESGLDDAAEILTGQSGRDLFQFE